MDPPTLVYSVLVPEEEEDRIPMPILTPTPIVRELEGGEDSLKVVFLVSEREELELLRLALKRGEYTKPDVKKILLKTVLGRGREALTRVEYLVLER